jgi:hypothetical protein
VTGSGFFLNAHNSVRIFEERDMFRVRMQSKSGSELFAAVDGHPSDWAEPVATLATEEEAAQLARLVVAKGYATPWVIKVI